MSIKARLDGDSFDMMMLAELFPASSDPGVTAGPDGFHLTSQALDGDLATEAFAIWDMANSMLRPMIGSARILKADFRPVRVTGHFYDEAGKKHVVLQVDNAVSRSYLSVATLTVDGTQAPSPPAVGPTYIQLATQNPDVCDALNLLGKQTELDWYDLWKVFEVVRDNVDPPPAGTNQKGRPRMLIQAGLLTKEELDAFTGSSNHQLASGDAARHARERGPAPTQVLSIAEGRALLQRVARSWLDALRSAGSAPSENG